MAIKKQWYDIIAPKLFDEKKVGETLSSDPKRLVGRTISVSLADLTGDYSKFYLKLLFQIEKVDEKAHTKFIGHECMHERIYRMVHRYMRRVDCIHDVTTKDDRKVRVKIVFILVKRVNTSIKDSARDGTKRLLERIAKEKTLDDFIKMIITNELQNTIKKEIGKIYPIGNIEIRKSELLEEAGREELKPETKKEKKEKLSETKKQEETKEEVKEEGKKGVETKKEKETDKAKSEDKELKSDESKAEKIKIKEPEMKSESKKEIKSQD